MPIMVHGIWLEFSSPWSQGPLRRENRCWRLANAIQSRYSNRGNHLARQQRALVLVYAFAL